MIHQFQSLILPTAVDNHCNTKRMRWSMGVPFSVPSAAPRWLSRSIGQVTLRQRDAKALSTGGQGMDWTRYLWILDDHFAREPMWELRGHVGCLLESRFRLFVSNSRHTHKGHVFVGSSSELGDVIRTFQARESIMVSTWVHSLTVLIYSSLIVLVLRECSVSASFVILILAYTIVCSPFPSQKDKHYKIKEWQ